MGLPIATVNIVLRTSTVTRAGFGTPIFISSHRNFVERVRSYPNITAVAEDFFTTDAAYIAATSFWQNTPRITGIKIGRRVANPVFTPTTVETGKIFRLSFVSTGVGLTLEYTAGAGDDAADVATALVAAIPVADPILDYISVVDSTGSVTVTTVSGSVEYYIDDMLNMTAAYTSSETAADVLNAVREVDDDFYFVTAEDHTAAFVEAMADAVQATEKVYFTSSQEVASLATYTEAATDTLGILKTNNYSRTNGMYYHEADSVFPECNYIGSNASYAPDVRAVVWDGRQLVGLSVSKNSSGNQITATQQLNLEARNASYLVNTNAGVRILGGKMANGTWIDDQITVDCMTARVREGQEALILNQQGTKLPGGREGVGLCESELASSLNPFISADSIDDYQIFSENAAIDPQTRTLTGLEFIAYLKGSIQRVIINGDLVNQEV